MEKIQQKSQKTAEEQRKDYLADLMFQGHLKVTLRVFLLVVVPLTVLGGGGFLLDGYLGTKPFLTILGVVLAFAFSQAFTVRVIKRLTEK